MPCKTVSETSRLNSKENYKVVYFKWSNLVWFILSLTIYYQKLYNQTLKMETYI